MTDEAGPQQQGRHPPQPEPPLVRSNEDEEEPNKTQEDTDASNDDTEEIPRQWLIDRCNGKSKVNVAELGRPFCPLCWPPPCVKWLPSILEQNSCCESFGAVGCFLEDDASSRHWLMRMGLVVHLIGGILSILSCFALSTDGNLLQVFPFSSGSVTGTVGDTDIKEVIFKVGLRSIFVEDFYFGKRTFDMGELCTGKNLGIPLTSLKDCATCQDVSGGLIFTMIISIVTYVPSLASNVNRMYYNYDINCQKVFGTMVALFSIAMSLYTWRGYANQCFDNFYDGAVEIPVWVPGGNETFSFVDAPFLSFLNASYLQEFMENADTGGELPNMTQLFPGANDTLLGENAQVEIARVNFDWAPGTGLILIVIATFIKLIDVIHHCLLRTPSITRDLQEQRDYEKAHEIN